MDALLLAAGVALLLVFLAGVFSVLSDPQRIDEEETRKAR
jgi:hypothetical protein